MNEASAAFAAAEKAMLASRAYPNLSPAKPGGGSIERAVAASSCNVPAAASRSAAAGKPSFRSDAAATSRAWKTQANPNSARAFASQAGDALQEPAARGLDLRGALAHRTVQLEAPQLVADPPREVFGPAGVHAEAFLCARGADPLARFPAEAREGSHCARGEELVGDHGPPRFHWRNARSSSSLASAGTSSSVSVCQSVPGPEGVASCRVIKILGQVPSPS